MSNRAKDIKRHCRCKRLIIIQASYKVTLSQHSQQQSAYLNNQGYYLYYLDCNKTVMNM